MSGAGPRHGFGGGAPWIGQGAGRGAIPPRHGFQFAFQNGADFAAVGMFIFRLPTTWRLPAQCWTDATRSRPVGAARSAGSQTPATLVTPSACAKIDKRRRPCTQFNLWFDDVPQSHPGRPRTECPDAGGMSRSRSDDAWRAAGLWLGRGVQESSFEPATPSCQRILAGDNVPDE